MAARSVETKRSEDELGNKWDHCITDTTLKIASGTGLGAVFSLLFFKRRPWPMLLGLGIGIGLGYANCNADFKNPGFLHGKLKKIESGARLDLK